MKQIKNILKPSFSHPFATNGFGTTETVVAAGAGILLIAASTLALRSTQNLISKSKSTSTLRQNTTNGLRLLRSEVERSLHILVNNSEAVMSGMEHTEMGNSQYETALEACRLKAEDSSQIFKPVFGIKMADLNDPVIYGLGLSSNNLIFKAKANDDTTKINSQQGRASVYDTTNINSQQGRASVYDTTNINSQQGIISGYNTTNTNSQQGTISGYNTTNTNSQQGTISGYNTTNTNSRQGRISGDDTTNINSRQGRISGDDTTNINSRQGKISGDDTTNINSRQGRISRYDTTNINSQQGRASGYDTTNINSQQGKASGYEPTKINYEGGKASGYALLRCGAPLSLDGRYSETEDVFISKAIEDIGVMNCIKPNGDCTNSPNYNLNLKEILDKLDFTFTDEKTPVTTYREPSLRIMTDQQRKLIKFVDPNPDILSSEKESYLEVLNAANKRITRYPLYLAAFARADKRPGNYGENSVINGAYFRNVSSQKVRFLVDGSASMSTCILWSSTSGQMRTYWSGQRYRSTRQNCALTRMESLQSELISLITALPKSTKVGIQSFSSPGDSNHRTWSESSDGLVRIGNDGMRESAIAFVNSLDDGHPNDWGWTQPWEGLDASFEDDETDTLYFLSDGQPNEDREGSDWEADDHGPPTVDHYSNLNNTRKQALKINTIALGLKSPWMEKLSTKTNGDHLQIDKDYVTTNSSR
ncbi:hypothetical protein [Prochlorococcus sp. MIT 1303]|uniref:hypothetical protein n=1 Tax=Prochlorococcus sp. MIT 1303 TaxID=1723647 RepID=UPI0007BC520B|nr:hypothetical protein [Prochlorococcus sp. MIT 1303]KZR65747.1 hypothetical protein PMIT1303_01196 [Prochlorococcus sp. MIT 1303]